MLGQAVSMVLPKVVGYKLTGKINPLATSTDVVLTITKVREDNCDFSKTRFLTVTPNLCCFLLNSTFAKSE